MNDILFSFLTTVLGGIPAVIAVVLSNRSHDKVIDERLKNTNELINERTNNTNDRIQELSARVEKHNNLIERMALVEASTKSAHKRIDDISSQLQITERRSSK